MSFLNDYACPECGYDGPHSQIGPDEYECPSCYVEFSTAVRAGGAAETENPSPK